MSEPEKVVEIVELHRLDDDGCPHKPDEAAAAATGGVRVLPKPSEILKAARELIASPEHWTRNNAARLANGNACEVNNPNAAKWCAIGALWRAERDAGVEFDGDNEDHRLNIAATSYLDRAAQLTDRGDVKPYSGIIALNDYSLSHSLVMAAYDKAIAAAEADEVAAAAALDAIETVMEDTHEHGGEA